MALRDTELEEDFLRDFCKAQAFMWEDSSFSRLPFEVQGVWWALLLFSMTKSKIPGWFLDKGTGQPMTDNQIAYSLALEVERIDVVKAALQALKRAGEGRHLAYAPREGWSIPNYSERFCTNGERKKVRRADAARQRRRRDKEKNATRGKLVAIEQAGGRS